ncbi:MAG: hypothetical protein AB7P22_17160, partial [Vicinamibacterales bacterium]
MSTARTEMVAEVLRRFAAAIRSGQLYARTHPIIGRNVAALGEALRRVHDQNPSIVIGIVGDEIIVDDTPAPRGDNLTGFVRRLKQIGVERVTIDRGVTHDEIAEFINAIVTVEPLRDESSLPEFQHIRVGRVTVEDQQTTPADMATFKRMYSEAVKLAETVWESARTESQPDAPAARTMVESLAQAISENRTALVALSTLRQHDEYTFTHMVNVSILTMSQARS